MRRLAAPVPTAALGDPGECPVGGQPWRGLRVTQGAGPGVAAAGGPGALRGGGTAWGAGGPGRGRRGSRAGLTASGAEMDEARGARAGLGPGGLGDSAWAPGGLLLPWLCVCHSPGAEALGRPLLHPLAGSRVTEGTQRKPWTNPGSVTDVVLWTSLQELLAPTPCQRLRFCLEPQHARAMDTGSRPVKAALGSLPQSPSLWDVTM